MQVTYLPYNWNFVSTNLPIMDMSWPAQRLVASACCLPSNSHPFLLICWQVIYNIRKQLDCDIGVQSFFISPSNGDSCQR